MSNIAKESVPGISDRQGFPHGWVVVGTSPVQLTAKIFAEVYKGVLIVADPDNTNTIFLGRASVTSDKDPDTGGIPLPPGASITIPIEAPQLIYAISDAATQRVAWMTI